MSHQMSNQMTHISIVPFITFFLLFLAFNLSNFTSLFQAFLYSSITILVTNINSAKTKSIAVFFSYSSEKTTRQKKANLLL